MNGTPAINLLTPRVGSNDEWIARIERICMWCFGVFIGLGIVVSGVYLILSQVNSQLENQKKELLAQIASQTTKEGLLSATHERLTIDARVGEKQVSYGNAFSVIQKLVPLDVLQTISIDSGHKIAIVATIPSIDSAQQIVQSLVVLANEKQIRAPQLVSLTIAKDKTLRFSFSFVKDN